MALPSEINALKYYELEIKARGFDILQELEALNDRVLILKNEKNKVIKELQSLYLKMQENVSVQSAPSPDIQQIDQDEQPTRTIKSVHEVGGSKK